MPPRNVRAIVVPACRSFEQPVAPASERAARGGVPSWRAQPVPCSAGPRAHARRLEPEGVTSSGCPSGNAVAEAAGGAQIRLRARGALLAVVRLLDEQRDAGQPPS